MNSKLKNGYVAEEKFILECLSRNIPISRPIYNVEPYDFVIQTVNGFRSVQVKKSWIDKKGRNVVSIKSSYPRSSRTRYVNEDSADYLAVLVDYWDWYIIPCSAFVGKTSNICVSKQGAYSEFLNNWNFEQGAVPCPQQRSGSARIGEYGAVTLIENKRCSAEKRKPIAKPWCRQRVSMCSI